MGSYQQQQLYTQLASFNSSLNSGLSIQPVGSGDTIRYESYLVLQTINRQSCTIKEKGPTDRGVNICSA